MEARVPDMLVRLLGCAGPRESPCHCAIKRSHPGQGAGRGRDRLVQWRLLVTSRLPGPAPARPATTGERGTAAGGGHPLLEPGAQGQMARFPLWGHSWGHLCSPVPGWDLGTHSPGSSPGPGPQGFRNPEEGASSG